MERINFEKAKSLDASDIRNCIRNDLYTGHTAGLAKNKLQTNIVILPKEYSKDFTNFCELNKKACPLVDKTDIGDPFFYKLGENIDVRFDVPSYNIYKSGKLVNSSVLLIFRHDFVKKLIISYNSLFAKNIIS